MISDGTVEMSWIDRRICMEIFQITGESAHLGQITGLQSASLRYWNLGQRNSKGHSVRYIYIYIYYIILYIDRYCTLQTADIGCSILPLGLGWTS